MSCEPEAKKRRMEPHIGGDTCRLKESDTKPPTSTSKLPKGSASGDFGNSIGHQFVTVIAKNESNDAKDFEILKQGCGMGDVWNYKFPIPLSRAPSRAVRTGNVYYDAIVPDLELLGYRPLQVVAKGRSATIVMSQDLHKLSKECEYIPVALKLNTGKSRRKSRGSCRTDMTEEMNIHMQLDHPCIVTWLNNVSYQGRIGTVLEFCENGNLEQLLRLHDARFLTESVSRKYFRQIFSAVEYLHGSGFAHRDICPNNVLITFDNKLKLADFGHSVMYFTGDKFCEDDSGTIGYQAPEIIQKKPYNPKMADMWSLGCILYSMTVGKLPFGLIKSEILQKASKELKYPPAKVMPLSQNLKALHQGLIRYNPEDRYSINRIKYSDWLVDNEKRVQIGNFYLVRQPKKIKEGDLEKELKYEYEI